MPSVSLKNNTTQEVINVLTDATTPDEIGAASLASLSLLADSLGTAASANVEDFAPALTADENHVTDTEKAALHTHSNKSALDQVSGINTGDQDLSGKSDTNHNHALNDLSEKSYNSLTDKPTIPATAADVGAEESRTYTGAVIGTGVSLPNAIAALDDALTIEEYPVTAVVVTGWTVLSGTVADLAALGGNTMILQEGGGAGSNVELQYDGVNLLSDVHHHYRYYSTSGSTGHTTDWQIFNVTSGLWESFGIATSGNTVTLELMAKHFENGTDYITSDANKRVRVRFYHTSNTSATHRLELDHCMVAHGISAVGTITSHAGLSGRSLADQHPISAISGVHKSASFTAASSNGATSGAITIDWSANQSYFQAEPTGTITYTFTAPPGSAHLQLFIDSDGTSTAQTINFPTLTWLGSTWTPFNNKKAVISIWYDGTNYYAMGSNQV